ncbi:hypothetical protein M413DRAFT_322778 [Hebeloma cylindrosporum]|uniref:Uncharacterized protein n=1 Tax=Hebeloma cylindrosporum TaxID=76867 RepID=A0A0C3BXI4_HEBCY|nr:hypothetical protein M413DRAFT_322778 [Hebeloma cylindrosporum h7]
MCFSPCSPSYQIFISRESSSNRASRRGLFCERGFLLKLKLRQDYEASPKNAHRWLLPVSLRVWRHGRT